MFYEGLDAEAPPRPVDSAESLLLQAADLIEITGWIQGNAFRSEEGYCALGAIFKIEQDAIRHKNHRAKQYAIIARHKLRRVVAELGFDKIQEWNDAPGRTTSDVIKVLRQTARRKN